MCSYSFKDFRIPLVFLNIGGKITPLFYKNQRIFINILIIHISLEAPLTSNLAYTPINRLNTCSLVFCLKRERRLRSVASLVFVMIEAVALLQPTKISKA